MTDPAAVALLGVSLVAALLVAAVALLKGWKGWLELKRLELTTHEQVGLAPTGGRIEIADLKERVRNLEAIAAGIDL